MFEKFNFYLRIGTVFFYQKKSKMKLLKSLTIVATFIIVLSCAGDELILPTSTPENNLAESYQPERNFVTGTVFGTVTDESNNPVINASIVHRGRQYFTNENGNFIIKDQSLNSKGAFFTVEKAGFFKGSRRFYPQDESINYVYVQLMELDEIGRFEASVGANLVGNEGIEISFPENSIQSADGSLYAGEVSVAAKYLDPTADNINEIMPGDLVGVSSDLEDVDIQTTEFFLVVNFQKTLPGILK